MNLRFTFFVLAFLSFSYVLQAQAVDSVYKVADLEINTVQFLNVFDGTGSAVLRLGDGVIKIFQ